MIAAPLEPKKTCFGRNDFQLDLERNAMICPQGQELRFLGRYPTDSGLLSYQLYGRADCSDCTAKAQCTSSRGRRVKVVDSASKRHQDDGAESRHLLDLIAARDQRMEGLGKALMKLRSCTAEPVNAQVRQHGLARFHVHCFERCKNILTLGCVAHNLMKWRTKEASLAAAVAA